MKPKRFFIYALVFAVCSCGNSAQISQNNDNDDISEGNSYAVSRVKVKNKDNTQYTNILDYLRGKVPGVQIAPDGSVRVRGVSSVNSGSDPLIIVDGAQISDINLVNPNDVYSITVIKDASTAIYGFRGVNGVIDIKTKTAQNVIDSEEE